MMLGGLALAFSRLIDNSVVVLENIYRHLEEGEDPQTAAVKGGQEVSIPVLAATLATGIVFFPVTLLTGVSRYFFGALASAVVISLAASYLVAVTVVPLYCSLFIRRPETPSATNTPGPLQRLWARFLEGFEQLFAALLNWFGGVLSTLLPRARMVVLTVVAVCVACFALLPFVGTSYFPRTDPSQFVVSVKAFPEQVLRRRKNWFHVLNKSSAGLFPHAISGSLSPTSEALPTSRRCTRTMRDPTPRPCR
jgi:multidrug efflux pump subunit AcrB